MRDLKIGLVGLILFFAPFVCAEDKYKVLILPDNIVTENLAIDSYIYNSASEFFASGVINILNNTDYIKSPTVSEERALLKSKPSSMIPAKNLLSKFKNTYNVDFQQLKKVANVSGTKYVLLLTTTLDSENYILRRTFWDFLNIPGATVIDPAYKVNTYAVLVDTSSNNVLWSNTFYKTISTVENRILTRGPSPQTEQLQKLRDYSRMLCPEIAQNVQVNVLPPDVYSKESKQIYYDMADFDNIFTKKYRRWNKEGKKDFHALKSNTSQKVDSAKAKHEEAKQKRALKRAEKASQQIAQPEEYCDNCAEYTDSRLQGSIQDINYNTESKSNEESLYEPIFIKKKRKNNLYGNYDSSKPPLRNYDRL